MLPAGGEERSSSPYLPMSMPHSCCFCEPRPGAGRTVPSSGDGRVRVTVSIGATIARPDDTMATLVKRADDLMYKSKTAGRNCVTLGE